MKTIREISEHLFLSESTVKKRINLLGIVHIEKENNGIMLYSLEQIELIKKNYFRQYLLNDGFIIYESKINKC